MLDARIRQDDAYVDEWKSLWEPDSEAIAYNGIYHHRSNQGFPRGNDVS